MVLFEEHTDDDCVVEESTPVSAFLKADQLELDFGTVYMG